jgi:plastocyanin
MKKVIALLVLALASFALVACGSSDNTSSNSTPAGGGSETSAPAGGKAGGESTSAKAKGGSASAVDISAVEGTDLAYDQKSVDAKAGQVTVNFENPQALSHDVAIEDSSGKTVGETELIGEGSTSTVVDNLKPGTYTFYCTVPGHREAGMEGTLTVK